eukprot:3628060-Pyramimonas_sp.AAC.1
MARAKGLSQNGYGGPLGNVLDCLEKIFRASWTVVKAANSKKSHMLKMYVPPQEFNDLGLLGPSGECSGSTPGPYWAARDILAPSWGPLGTLLARLAPSRPLWAASG